MNRIDDTIRGLRQLPEDSGLGTYKYYILQSLEEFKQRQESDDKRHIELLTMINRLATAEQVKEVSKRIDAMEPHIETLRTVKNRLWWALGVVASAAIGKIVVDWIGRDGA